ncbi:GMC family oxidoreductase [Nocardioides panacis]|uniref:GMC family oxidoreductase n=1 Tax=Nocardioides panacis TaxID=2849501 RepID=A0A975SZC0_9ACTN|nr:GMC family oxidoreductase [Nocardioides panacis]QWZ08717.1 GMC family oxidoreductase [Nocardioides panacis]
MEPYYTAAENLYQVHGARGVDPTEPPASAPYPFPPVSHEPRIQRLFDDMADVGLHPFHSPSGVMLDEVRPERSACIRCATCDGFPCLVHAKADADVVAVRPALEHDNVTLLRTARVRRLETDASGRTVSAVLAEVAGGGAAVQRRRRRALCRCGELGGDPARQRQRPAPAGVGQRLGPGRSQLRVPQQPRVPGGVQGEERPRFQKTLGLNDYYFWDPDFDYPMGNLQMVGKSSAPMYKGEKPVEAGLAPLFALRDVAEHAVDFWLSVEDIPEPDNRVTLDADGRVVLACTPNNQEPMDQLYHRTKKHLGRLGMHPHHLVPRNVYMKNDVPVAGCAHQAGTVRFGTDPATSVLDVSCKAHEVDNLYVVDTGFFPSIGAVNPALTAIANALRVGDHLLERLA